MVPKHKNSRERTSPTLCPHALNPPHGAIKRELEQFPPPLTLEFLTPLTSAHVEFLLPSLSRYLVGGALHLQRAKSAREIHAPLEVDVNLPAELRAQLQVDTADGQSVVVCLGGIAHRAGHGRQIRWPSSRRQLDGLIALPHHLCCTSRVVRIQVETVHEVVKLAATLLGV